MRPLSFLIFFKETKAALGFGNIFYFNSKEVHIMKYSDSVKAILLAAIDELAADPEKYAHRPGKDFTRNRKLGLKQFLLLFLTMEGECIKEELYTFFGRTKDAPSRAAYYKQLQKLRDGALRCLLLAFNRKLKNHLYNGKYRLIACDGSALDIFRNPDDPDTFFEPNSKSPKGYNQVYINACYSILDKRFTDLVVQPGRKRNEYSAFCQMVDAAGSADGPAIYICDRGYASYNNYAHAIENGQYFLIRCTDAKTKKLLGRNLEGIGYLDTHVERILSRSQSKKKREHPELEESYRHVSKRVPMDYITDTRREYSISLRVIRFELSPGSFENLITNLPDHGFDLDDFRELYHLRWGLETAFRFIKHTLCLKALHSKKYEYAVKEVWARAILYNFCSEIALHVEIEQQEGKHEYQVNYSEASKTCRDFLRIHDGKSKSGMDVEGLIADSIEPVRPGRAFPRQKRFKIPMSFCYRN